MPFAGRLLHDVQILSEVGLHSVRYWPFWHVDVLQGEHVDPERKYPVLQFQSHASAPYGLPAEVYCALAGALVHGTHCPFADAVQAERYCPTAHDVVSHAKHDDPTLK